MKSLLPAPDSPLRNGPFLQLMVYRLSSILSYQVVAVTVGWHVYELTGNPFSLGLIGLAEVIPYFLTAPFAGYLVDHVHRRKLGALACAMLGVTPLLLVAITLGWLPWSGPGAIYAAILLTGAVRSFLGPVYNALFARVLPRQQYARGAGFGSVVFQAGLVIGPALGGALIGLAGKHVAYAAAVGFALVAMVAVRTLRVTEPPPAPKLPVLRSIAEGARFVWGHQVLVAALALDMFAVLLGGAVALWVAGFDLFYSLFDAEHDRLFALFLEHYGSNIPGKSKPYPGVLDALDEAEGSARTITLGVGMVAVVGSYRPRVVGPSKIGGRNRCSVRSPASKCSPWSTERMRCSGTPDRARPLTKVRRNGRGPQR
mgnify:CR=1 FL=1